MLLVLQYSQNQSLWFFLFYIHVEFSALVSFWFIFCTPVTCNLSIVFNVTFFLLFTICTIYYYWLVNWIQFGVRILFCIDTAHLQWLAFAVCGQKKKIVNLNLLIKWKWNENVVYTYLSSLVWQLSAAVSLLRISSTFPYGKPRPSEVLTDTIPTEPGLIQSAMDLPFVPSQ